VRTAELSLRRGHVVEGSILPERVEVVIATREGEMVHLIGKGLKTGQFVDRRLTAAQIATLIVVGGDNDFKGDPLHFRLGVEALRLGLAYEYDPYFSLSIARVDPLPHQLEAVYDYFLKLPRIRFLLADDAGAGKTIMAGLLLKELKMRGLVSRILVVSPANLMFQWQREMKDRFRERFDILRGVDLQSAYGTNPWQEKDQVITSLDWAKRPEVVESLSRSQWDLVFVDEAHRMSARDAEHKTERYRLGEMLSDRSDHFVMLTATPHRGDEQNFCLFLRLLDPEVYADVASLDAALEKHEAPFYLRRTKEAMVTFPDPETGVVKQLFMDRDVRTTPFELLDEEYEFYKELTNYVHQQSARARDDNSARGKAIGFTMAMYQRRFASSLHAVVRSLERRRKKLQDILVEPEPQPSAPSFDVEDLEELDEEEAQRLIDKVEAATLPVDRAAIGGELAIIDGLLIRGKDLEAREVSSKLQELKDLLTKNGVFDDPEMKLLVFTEHRDTLEWLVARLRAWNLSVTQIHGGMKSGDRDTPGTRLHAERAFREECQILVATEAAGEGINLQFCWLMVNFDIPWNPVRLEQRMGRIHRYGQDHDCLIFNFVALNTFEGRVLAKLLDRLRQIRLDLGTDQVFDVIGEVLPGNEIERLIREKYAARLSEDQVLERIVQDADPERFRAITHSALESLSRKQLNLTALIGRMAEAKERRLVPEVVEDFFLHAAPLHELRPEPAGPAYRIGKVPKVLLKVAEELEPRFGKIGREYKTVVFDKETLKDAPTAEWVTPGHPLFEAVREQTLATAEDQLRRGAVFYELGRTSGSRLEVFTAAIKDGLGNPLHRRLLVVEVGADAALSIRQPTIFLDLVPGTSLNGALIPATSGGELEQYLVEHALQPLLEEVALERRRELAMVKEHVRISLDTLIDRQTNQLMDLAGRHDRGDDVGLATQNAQQRLEDLNHRYERRMTELASESEIAIADVHHLASAVVLPHPEGDRYQAMVSDPEIERIAMEEAMRHERGRNWSPQDVSSENRGFDILSQNATTGGVRFIEVKGRAGRGEVSLSRHEFITAGRLVEDYWLYVVYDCGTKPDLLLIQDPARLDPEAVMAVEHYLLTRDKVEGAAQRAD
jgi:superfamily II DNA or RNA helicase